MTESMAVEPTPRRDEANRGRGLSVAQCWFAGEFAFGPWQAGPVGFAGRRFRSQEILARSFRCEACHKQHLMPRAWPVERTPLSDFKGPPSKRRTRYSL